MAEKFISKKNIRFLLHEVFDAAALTRYDHYKMHTPKMFDMVIDESVTVAKKLMFKYLEEMDVAPPELVDGKVKVHPSVKAVMKETGGGGWISGKFPLDKGGDQLPILVFNAAGFVFAAANYSASVFPMASAGAAGLIISFGSEKLKAEYVPKLFSGKWQGAMALTEPQAGSSLSDICTTAYPADLGGYRIQGRKIFISAGDHDAVENVVHLMLARIDGAPAGIKGISLFVVPNKRLDENGLLIPNDIDVTQVYHKVGYRGTPLTELAIGERGDCHGFLVDEPHQGLKYMFQLMNEARIEIGLGATGIATAAYYAALEYTRDRPQGRRITDKNPALPQVPIIEHADIKRMLLFQRAVVEGSLSLLMQCSLYADMEIVSQGDDKEAYNLLLEVLTPVAKTYPSEMGILAVSAGLQCLGGYGFCDDFPLQQYYRDIRIHPIHEGTTGIQAMDLLGRKVVMQKGRAAGLFYREVQKTIEAANQVEELSPWSSELGTALEKLQAVTTNLKDLAAQLGPEAHLADAALYLELFGTVAIAWQWLLQAISAQRALDRNSIGSGFNFYQGKMMTCRYFFEYELPRIQGPVARLMKNQALTIQMKPEFFSD